VKTELCSLVLAQYRRVTDRRTDKTAVAKTVLSRAVRCKSVTRYTKILQLLYSQRPVCELYNPHSFGLLTNNAITCIHHRGIQQYHHRDWRLQFVEIDSTLTHEL